MVGQMGSQVIKPPKLSAGDTIGIIAPATPFTPAVPPAFYRRIASNPKIALGYSASSPHCLAIVLG